MKPEEQAKFEQEIIDAEYKINNVIGELCTRGFKVEVDTQEVSIIGRQYPLTRVAVRVFIPLNHNER